MPEGDRAAVYIRISNDREGAGLGVTHQEAGCRTLSTLRGWDVVKVLSIKTCRRIRATLRFLSGMYAYSSSVVAY